MAISYTYSTFVGTGGQVTVPTGNTGDVAIIVTENGNAPAGITAPGGWTATAAMYSHPSSNVRTRAFYQIMPGTAGGNVDLSGTGGDVIGAIRIAGADAVTPLTGMASPNSGNSPTSAPSVSINNGEDHLIVVCTDNTGATVTGPSGSSPTYTETKDQVGMAVYVGTYTSTTTTGTRNCSTTSDPLVIYSFAVVPGTPAAPTPAIPTLVQQIGTQVTNTAATTTVISFSGATKPQVGDLVTVYGSRDNVTNDAPTGSTDTFADTHGNTWVIDSPLCSPAGTSTANAGNVGVMFHTFVTTVWSGTTTLTWTHPSTKAAMQMEHWTNVTSLRGTNSGGSTAGAPSVALTTPQAADLVLGMASFEHSNVSTVTDDADTTNGSWSAKVGPTATTGTTLAACKIMSQYKIVTAGGTQTFNPTNSTTTNVDSVAIVAAFVAARFPNTSSYLPRPSDAVRRAANW